ncbi:unnamed protein product, partial [Prorocentrum cordatum]
GSAASRPAARAMSCPGGSSSGGGRPGGMELSDFQDALRRHEARVGEMLAAHRSELLLAMSRQQPRRPVAGEAAASGGAWWPEALWGGACSVSLADRGPPGPGGGAEPPGAAQAPEPQGPLEREVAGMRSDVGSLHGLLERLAQRALDQAGSEGRLRAQLEQHGASLRELALGVAGLRALLEPSGGGGGAKVSERSERPGPAAAAASRAGARPARLAAVHAVFHALCLLVALPALLLAVSAAMGTLLAVVEGWEVLDGIAYVGGNLVLIPLTDVVPTTTRGTVFDIIVSAFSFGLLGWGLAIVGLLPFCEGTHAFLHAMHSAVLGHRCPMLESFMTMCLFVVALWPLACLSVSAGVAALLALAEGRPYKRSLLWCLGILSHTPSLTSWEEHPETAEGKIIVLLLAFVGLGLTLGWMVGVCLQLPALGALVRVLRRVAVTRGESLVGKSVNFFTIVFAVVPLAVLPLSLVLGLLLKAAEGWESVTESLLYVGGNLVGIPLAAVGPTSTSGRAIDFLISSAGVGCFGFLVAAVGSLDFADTCCESLGGKAEGVRPAARFTIVFYLVVLPVTCAAVAAPLGGALSLAEGWSFLDGWLTVLSILVQAPSLATPDLEAVQSDGGRMALFLVACYALCVSIGWGAGLVVASRALDRVGSGISGAVRRLKAAVGADSGAQWTDGALTPVTGQ